MMPMRTVSGWVRGCQLKLSGNLLLEEESKVHLLLVCNADGFLPIGGNASAFPG